MANPTQLPVPVPAPNHSLQPLSRRCTSPWQACLKDCLCMAKTRASLVSWFLFVSSDSSREICVTDMGKSCVTWEDIKEKNNDAW